MPKTHEKYKIWIHHSVEEYIHTIYIYRTYVQPHKDTDATLTGIEGRKGVILMGGLPEGFMYEVVI